MKPILNIWSIRGKYMSINTYHKEGIVKSPAESKDPPQPQIDNGKEWLEINKVV